MNALILAKPCGHCGGEGWRTYVKADGLTLVVDEMCKECNGVGRVVIEKPFVIREWMIWTVLTVGVAAFLAAMILTR